MRQVEEDIVASARFLTIEQIRKKHEDLGRMTLHGTPPGDWFARRMDDISLLLESLDVANTARFVAGLAEEKMRVALEPYACKGEHEAGHTCADYAHASGMCAARVALTPGNGDVRVALEDLLNASINVAHLPVEAHLEWGKRAIEDFFASCPSSSTAARAEVEALLACQRSVEAEQAFHDYDGGSEGYARRLLLCSSEPNGAQATWAALRQGAVDAHAAAVAALRKAKGLES